MSNPIKEQKDRKPNPYWKKNKAVSLEDDYSEDSNANSVCKDNTTSWSK